MVEWVPPVGRIACLETYYCAPCTKFSSSVDILYHLLLVHFIYYILPSYNIYFALEAVCCDVDTSSMA